MRDPDEKFVLDLDRDRIKTIVLEAYKISQDFLSTQFLITAEDFASRIDPFLDSNRITIPVHLDLPSKKYPGMRLEIDLRRRKVFARLHPPKKQAILNHMLKSL